MVLMVRSACDDIGRQNHIMTDGKAAHIQMNPDRLQKFRIDQAERMVKLISHWQMAECELIIHDC